MDTATFYTEGLSKVRPICFLSDFGLGEDFVGLCKGVMLRISPDAAIIDLTHQVPGFAIEAGAEILEHATRYMPEDTVYLAIVDPGVGTKRRALALRTPTGALLVGPDNGLLVPAAESLGGIECAGGADLIDDGIDHGVIGFVTGDDRFEDGHVGGARGLGKEHGRERDDTLT